MDHKQIGRLSVQLFCAAGLTALFMSQDYSRAATQPLFTWSGWADPLQGFGAVLKNHWPYWAFLSLGMFAVAVVGGRFFCGWICPVGTLLDLTAYGKRLMRLPNHIPGPKMKRLWNWMRWIICGGIAGLLLGGWSIALSFNPFVVWPREVYRIHNGLIPWSIGLLIGVGLITFPRFWCRFICPAGSVLNWASRLGKQRYLNNERCKGCGRCSNSCPMANIDVKKTASDVPGNLVRMGSDCLHCGLCVRSCPWDCFSRQGATPARFDEGRRDFLIAGGFGLGALGVAMLAKTPLLEAAASKPGRWKRLLRPPGALAEEEFALACNRCGQCLQVCPTKVLVPAGLEAGLTGLGTPRFLPCRKPVPGRCMFCMACGQVCPTKALAPVPLETVRLGQPVINHATCLAWGKGIKCLLCVETCPKFAIRIDTQGRPAIDLSRCNGCGSCEAHCPVAGSAVMLTNVGETRRV